MLIFFLVKLHSFYANNPSDYTKDILLAIESGVKDSVKPLLDQPTLASAWSIDIHAQSRMVAIGTNARTVEVFALALADKQLNCLPGQGGLRDWAIYDHGSRRCAEDKNHTYRLDCVLPCHQDGSMCRALNFKIILRLDPFIGHNIPALAFSSDKNGEADLIIAKDVRGALWFMEIYSGHWKRLQTVEWNDEDDDFDPQ